MCTYETTKLCIQGSGKGTSSWRRVTSATVYLDHPVSAPGEHTLNLDFLNQEAGPDQRTALELDPQSARELAHAILATLESSSAQKVLTGQPAPGKTAKPVL